MAVPYALMKLKVRSGEDAGKEKYYAHAISSGDSDIEKLSELVSARSSLSAADVKSMLDSLNWVMPIELREGKTIRLGDWGSFFISVSSEGTEEAKKFNAGRIKRARIKFKPGSVLKKMLNNLSYEPEKTKEVKVEVDCDKPHA